MDERQKKEYQELEEKAKEIEEYLARRGLPWLPGKQNKLIKILICRPDLLSGQEISPKAGTSIMNHDVRKILIELLATHGHELGRQHNRLKGFLLDRCPKARREVAVLVLAAEVGIAKELYQDNGTTSPGLLLPRLIVRLYDDYGIDRKLAAWVVESWAEALKEARASARPKEDLAPLDSTPEPANKQTFTINGVSFNMVRIPAGEFMMGSPLDEPGRKDDETQHLVRITRDYWLGETQVTQGLWTAVMGDNPSYFDDCGLNYPVEMVSWDDCQFFIQRLNGHIPDGGFRLPTEAEWEYACRAGTVTPFYTGRCLGTDEANYDGNYPVKECPEGEERNRTTEVASFAPNAWGLYDMHGNVEEWCQDRYAEYPSGIVIGTKGPMQAADRICRGGGYCDTAQDCRSADRDSVSPGFNYNNLGVRLARTHIEKHSVQLSALPVTAVPKINKPLKYTKLGYGGVELPDDATQEQGWIMTRDNETGLIWEVKTHANKYQKYNWQDAQTVFIDELNHQHYFGGFISGWRLPEIEELKTLIKKGWKPTIDIYFFPNTVSAAYWTSTLFRNIYPWSVNFNSGYVSHNFKSSSHSVRAVISSQTLYRQPTGHQLLLKKFTHGV